MIKTATTLKEIIEKYKGEGFTAWNSDGNVVIHPGEQGYLYLNYEDARVFASQLMEIADDAERAIDGTLPEEKE